MTDKRRRCHPESGTADPGDGNETSRLRHLAGAKSFAVVIQGAEVPLALALWRDFIVEPEPGCYGQARAWRMTEWPAAFLRRPRRTDRTIPDFLAPGAPPNRLELLRGEV